MSSTLTVQGHEEAWEVRRTQSLGSGNIRQEGWGEKSEQGGGFISHMYKDDSHREQVVIETVAGANSPLRSFQCGEYGRQSQRKYRDFRLRAALCGGKTVQEKPLLPPPWTLRPLSWQCHGPPLLHSSVRAVIDLLSIH